MPTTCRPARSADARRGATRLALVGGLLLAVVAATGCAGAPEPPPGPDPQVRPYCDTVARVQAEQGAPGATARGVPAVAEATRRQNAALVRTAPPELVEPWRTVERLTEQSLTTLERTGGDARRIDRGELDRLRRDAAPAVERITAVTEQRCGIAFRGGPG